MCLRSWHNPGEKFKQHLISTITTNILRDFSKLCWRVDLYKHYKGLWLWWRFLRVCEYDRISECIKYLHRTFQTLLTMCYTTDMYVYYIYFAFTVSFNVSLMLKTNIHLLLYETILTYLQHLMVFVSKLYASYDCGSVFTAS